MDDLRPRSRRVTRNTAAFVAGAAAVAVALILAAGALYSEIPDGRDEFERQLANLMLQLALIVIAGALVKALIEWGTTQRARHAERADNRMDLLRRVRRMHFTIDAARTLLRAHRSAKSYGEQVRRLMELRPEVEEISEDILASRDLFSDPQGIRGGLEAIVNYLVEAEREYDVGGGHEQVDAGYKAGKTLDETINRFELTWVKDFMAGGPGFETSYVEVVKRTKAIMRADVYEP